MKLSEVGGWVREHPYASGGIVFVIGLIILYFYFRRGAAAPAQDNGMAAYYAAQAQVAASGNQLAAAQIAGNVQGQAIIQAADVAKAQTAGAVTVATGQQGVDTAAIAASKEVALGTVGAQQTLGLADVGAMNLHTTSALTLGLEQTRAALTAALSHDTTLASIAKLSADTSQYVAYVQALPSSEVSSSAYPASQMAAYGNIPGGMAVAFGGVGSPERTRALATPWQDYWNVGSGFIPQGQRTLEQQIAFDRANS